jgi:hypothetical protein
MDLMWPKMAFTFAQKPMFLNLAQLMGAITRLGCSGE